MKCPNCDGTGKAEIGVGAFTIHGADCDQCNGKGIIEPLTNEEWLKQCDTEHLAWMISLFVGNAIAKHDCGNDEDIKPIKWVEWLKQPHTPKE